MPYAILRIQKLKTWGAIGGAAQHNLRLRNTPNVDRERASFNEALVKTTGLVEAVKKGIGNNGGKKVRKNAVLAVEIFCSASPEYFRPQSPEVAGLYDQERMEAWRDATMKWMKEKWDDRIVSVVVHLDESTPHIHAVMVPMVDGRLNCRKLLGGSRQVLRDLQSGYAGAVRHLGLERGLKGSCAKHVKVSQFYGQVNSTTRVKLPALPKAPEPLVGLAKYNPLKQEEYAQGMKKAAVGLYKQRNVAINFLRKSESKVSEAIILKKQVETLKRENSRLSRTVESVKIENTSLKNLASQVRKIELSSILEQYPNRDKVQEITLREGKFYIPGQKRAVGRNAIDLVMYLESCPFEDAVRMLALNYSQQAVVADLTAQAAEMYRKKVGRILKMPTSRTESQFSKTWEEINELNRIALAQREKIEVKVYNRIDRIINYEEPFEDLDPWEAKQEDYYLSLAQDFAKEKNNEDEIDWNVCDAYVAITLFRREWPLSRVVEVIKQCSPGEYLRRLFDPGGSCLRLVTTSSGNGGESRVREEWAVLEDIASRVEATGVSSIASSLRKEMESAGGLRLVDNNKIIRPKF